MTTRHHRRNWMYHKHECFRRLTEEAESTRRARGISETADSTKTRGDTVEITEPSCADKGIKRDLDTVGISGSSSGDDGMKRVLDAEGIFGPRGGIELILRGVPVF